MEQLRIYTLVDKETAENYFKERWSKHIKSLPKFGIEVKGVWIGSTTETENQLIAVVSFPDNVDINEVNELYMKSPDFIEEMKGFDISSMINVETKIMKSLF